MDEKPSGAALFLYFIFAVVFGTLARAAALVACWGWFAVPVGAPHLGAWHLLGLSALGQVLIPNYPRANEETTHGSMVVLMLMSLIVPLFALGFGWIYHAMM